MEIKKEYVAPALEVLDIEFESLMLSASSGETLEENVGSGTAGNGPELVRGRRGIWGDLWN